MNSGLSTCFLICLEHSKGISYIVKRLPAKRRQPHKICIINIHCARR